jgi:hypothetical protein
MAKKVGGILTDTYHVHGKPLSRADPIASWKENLNQD